MVLGPRIQCFIGTSTHELGRGHNWAHYVPHVIGLHEDLARLVYHNSVLSIFLCSFWTNEWKWLNDHFPRCESKLWLYFYLQHCLKLTASVYKQLKSLNQVEIYLQSKTMIVIFKLTIICFKDFIHLFLKRGEGREKKGRETSRETCIGCLSNAP